MSWTSITLADLNDARAGKLVEALRTKALADGQTDPLPRVTQIVVDEIRRCIEFCPGTRSDSDPTKIPAGLKDLAVQKVIRLLKSRLLMALTDDEKESERLYQKRLEQLTKGDWPVDKPDSVTTPPAVQSKGNVQVVHAPHQLTSHDLAGL